MTTILNRTILDKDESEDMETVISTAVQGLSRTSELERSMIPAWEGPLPSVDVLREIISIVKTVVFPDFLDSLRGCRAMHESRLEVSLDKLMRLLGAQIDYCLMMKDDAGADAGAEARGVRLALRLISRIPEIKRLLYTDVRAIFDNDPAAANYGEVVLGYPVVQAMVNYRVAHELVLLGVPVLPRIITELAHSETGIDINPGARIGEYFAIDHGTGVVIGETCIIGNHVTLYQGVTLGAKNFTLDGDGHPMNVPRHPVIEDGVTIYANSTVLGRVTVGHDSVIGGNVWLTESVPPYSRVFQPRAELGIRTDRPS